MNQLGAYRVFPEIKKSGLLLPCFKPHTRMVDNQPLPARTNTRTSLTQPTTAFLTKIIALFDGLQKVLIQKGLQNVLGVSLV